MHARTITNAHARNITEHAKAQLTSVHRLTGLLLHSDWRWVALVALLNWGRLVALLNRGRLVALLNRGRLLEYWLRVCSYTVYTCTEEDNAHSESLTQKTDKTAIYINLTLRLVNVGVVRRWIHVLPARAS